MRTYPILYIYYRYFHLPKIGKQIQAGVSILLLILCSFAVASETVYVSQTSEQQEFNHAILYFEDAKDEYSFEDVIVLDDTVWTKNNTDMLDFGFTTSAYWLKFTFKNKEAKPKQFILDYAFAPIDRLEVYVLQDDQRSIEYSYKTGDQQPFNTRPIGHSNFAFPIYLETEEEQTVLLKISTEGTLIAPLSISYEHLFYKQHTLYNLIYAFVFTAMFLTAIYNIFVFSRTNEKVFLTFSIFALSISLLIASQSGLAFQFFWPNDLPWLNRLTPFFAGLAAVTHLLFSFVFLAPSPKIKKLFLFMLLLNLVVLLLAPFATYVSNVKAVLGIGMTSAAISYVLGIVLWSRGNKHAKEYCLVWSLFIIGAVISASIRFGIMPFNWFTEYSGTVGAVLTTVFMSMALGDRIRTEKQNRIEAQHVAINSLKMYQQLFENTVEGIFFLDEKMRFISVNPAFLSIFGYRSQDALPLRKSDVLETLFFNPVDLQELKLELREHKSTELEIQLKKTDGSKFWASLSVRLFSNSNNKDARIEGSVIDINNRKLNEDKLRYLASHDPLTGAYNRREFECLLSQAFVEAQKGFAKSCVLYMDLDQFKILNDTCGHPAGDILLRDLTQQMIGALGTEGSLARLGGDEFGVLIKRGSFDTFYRIANAMLSLVSNYRFTFQDKVFCLGISIGLIEVSHESESIEKIMSLADTACYLAKDAGRNRIHIYSAENPELQKRRTEMNLVTTINNALENDLFELYCQEIMGFKSGKKRMGFEVLLRMLDENQNPISPDSFIPAAERYNLMERIDKWVVLNTFAFLAKNTDLIVKGEHYSINLSGQSMTDDSFSDFLISCFSKYKIPYQNICFEITETVAVTNLSFLTDLMRKFQALGCSFSLDDFGSGFSSYGYLKNLPVNYIKIDGAFVLNIVEDKVNSVMVRSINDVAKALNMKTVAEFAENEQIVETLKEIGVDYMQGYQIHRPEKMCGAQNTSS